MTRSPALLTMSNVNAIKLEPHSVRRGVRMRLRLSGTLNSIMHVVREIPGGWPMGGFWGSRADYNEAETCPSFCAFAA